MATVTISERTLKSGKKSYVINYIDPKTEEKKYYASVRKKSDANALRSELRSILDRGMSVYSRKCKNTSQLVVDIATGCSLEWALRTSEGTMAKATHDSYKHYLNGILARFGNVNIRTITVEEVRIYRAEVAEDYSKCLANRRLFILKQIFLAAKAMGIHDCADILSISYLSEAEHERTRFLEPHEMARFLRAISKTRAKHYLPLIVLIGASQGASIQEMLSLRWSHINFEANGGIGQIQFYRTKNKFKRTQDLQPEVCEALLRWKAHLEKSRAKRGIKVVDDFVICHLDGSGMTNVKKAWEKACEVAGIEDFRVHDLRHCNASAILSTGGNEKDVMEGLGLKTPKMVYRYGHLTNDRKRETQARVSGFFTGSE